jgi:hypothetical protein
MRLQARCSMPRKFSATRSWRTTIRRKFCRKLPDEPISKRRVYQPDFMGRGALDVDGDREPLTIGDGHDPQNAIEHGTVLPPRTPSTVLSARRLG